MALSFTAVLAVFAGTLVLTAMIDYLELMRRTADIKDVSALVIAEITLFRVPFITERVMPFAVLVGAMFCYLNLSRRWSSWWRAPPASRPGSSSRPPSSSRP